MSANEELLSELCSICYTEPPKYRCPRCSTRTCSLPCYKRHQQRASCSGQRDPAAYLKKSQLATPTGIDQDYNYLKGVERRIDVAHRETRERDEAASEGGNGSKVFARGLNRDGPLQAYLAQHRIHVTRAPKGMSRQKANQTRVTKNKRIMWTVEWIDEGGSKTVQDNCVESNTLQELYQALQTEKNNAAKRKQAVQGQANTSSPKRQRVTTEAPEKPADDDTTTSTADKPAAGENAIDTAPAPNEEAEVSLPSLAEVAPQEVLEASRDPPTSGDPEPATTAPPVSDPPSSPPPPCFYLLKPSTASTKKVLILLAPTATLTESLSNRTVLEYPTIYLLPVNSASAALPSGFMAEAEYLAERKKEDADLGQAVRDAEAQGIRLDATRSGTGSDGKDTATMRQQEAAKNDPKRILEMLRRDLSTAS